MIQVAFPGLGISEFSLNPVLVNIPIFGGLQIRWYALCITLGIVIAFSYAVYRAKQVGISLDTMLDYAIFTVFFGVVGARLYYILFNHSSIHSFYDAIAIWNGGIAIYGALIGGGLTVFVICLIKKISFFKIADTAAPGVMIAQALGRWGNFFNGEAFGEQIAEGSPLYFIRMGLISSNTISDFNTSRMVFVHPTFLYECLWNVLGFVLINIFYKKKKFDGQIFFTYIAWYGFGRMFIESLRTDSLYVFSVIRISQVVGFVCFVIGVTAIVIGLISARRKALTALDYDPAFPKFETTASKAAGIVSDDEATTDVEDNDIEQTSQETDTDTDPESTQEGENDNG